MKKKGFTLVELLAVIAILAILVIIAIPNVLDMFNNAKINTFVTEAKTIYNETKNKYLSESMKGNRITTIISKDNTKLDLASDGMEYCAILDSDGYVKKLAVTNKSYYMIISNVEDVNSIVKEKVNPGSLDDMQCNA